MAYTQLKSDIAAVIKNNGNQDITGNVLQRTLIGMIDGLTEGYQYMGVATPDTSTTGITDERVFFIAGETGTYSNMGGTTHTGGIGIFTYNGSSWAYQNVPMSAFQQTDANPTAGSTNPVQSGGTLNAILTNGSAFDLSAYNSGTTYANLAAALTALNSLPAAYKKGGMSIKFVLSSDNKYVQFTLKKNTWSLNVNDWYQDLNTESSFPNTFSVLDNARNAILNLLSGLKVDKDGNIITKNFHSKGAMNAQTMMPTQLSFVDNNKNTILYLLSGLKVEDDGTIRTKNFNSMNVISFNNFQTCAVDNEINKYLFQMPREMLKRKMVDKTNRLVVSFNGDSIIGSQLADITKSPEYNTGAYPPNMSKMIMARQFLDNFQFTNADVVYRNLEHSDWIKTGFNVNKGKGNKDNDNSSFNEFETWSCESSEDVAQITISGYKFFKLIWSRGNYSNLWSCNLYVSIDGGSFVSPSSVNITLPDSFGKDDIAHQELQVYSVAKLDETKNYTFKIVPNQNYGNALVWGCEYWNNPRLDVVIEAYSGSRAVQQVERMLDAYCSNWHKPAFIISDVLAKNDESYIVGAGDTIADWQRCNATIYEKCRDNGIPLLMFAPHQVTTEWLVYAASGLSKSQNLPTIDIIKQLQEDGLTSANIVNTSDGQHLSNAGNIYYYNQLNNVIKF